MPSPGRDVELRGGARARAARGRGAAEAGQPDALGAQGGKKVTNWKKVTNSLVICIKKVEKTAKPAISCGNPKSAGFAVF